MSLGNWINEIPQQNIDPSTVVCSIPLSTKTILIIPGWLDGVKSKWVLTLENKLKPYAQIVKVQWPAYTDYAIAASYAKSIGKPRTNGIKLN